MGSSKIQRLIFAVICVGLSGASARGSVLTVPATSDLFSAGQSVASVARGGSVPIEIDLPSGTNRAIQFNSVTGSVMAGPNVWPLVGADGGTTMAFGARPTNIFSADGIAGMLHPNFEFLSGVFLNANTPVAGTEPARLDFNTIGQSFTDLSPLLQQSFFIGDGLTGTGSGQLQTFHVPDGATRLFLGFVDAYDFGWPSGAAPGQYADDTGSLAVQYTVVPEPTSCALILFGGLMVMWRKRERGTGRF